MFQGATYSDPIGTILQDKSNSDDCLTKLNFTLEPLGSEKIACDMITSLTNPNMISIFHFLRTYSFC